MTKRLIATIMALTIALTASAQTHKGRFAYDGFSGGMMLHTGWVSLGNITIGTAPSQRLSGLPLGIGGVLKLRFGDHLRVGTEGYTSSLGYGDYGSSLSIGWGGLLVDWGWQWGKLRPYVGATIGGGAVENLTLTSHPQEDVVAEENLSYRHYGVGVIVPFVGVDYPLSERMSLTFKADRITALGAANFDFPAGVRCYLGFMFNH